MRTTRQRPHEQAGFSLIEALVAILIFSIGVLALVALQATAIRQSSDSKYRSDASLLVNELIGQMWVSDRTAAALQANFGTGGTAYNNWNTRVQAALPAAAASAPAVAITGAGVVTVDVFWKAPNEDPAAPQHHYTAVAQVR